MQNDVQHDSREELLRHEHLVMRVLQNDGLMTKFGKIGNMAMKIMELVVYNVAWA